MNRGSRQIALVSSIFWLACSPAEPVSAPGDDDAARLVVFAVNEPLRTFAERIGGDAIEVHFPLPPDVPDPAFWSPSPDVVAAYQQADRVLLNGGGFAQWVERASLRPSRLVDCSASFRDRMIPMPDALTHAHGPEGDHSHAGVQTTFWLDLALAREQARAVADALARALPEESEAALRARHASLDAELAALDEQLAMSLARLEGSGVLFSHPVYGYLSRRYEVPSRSLHWEPDAEPGAPEWERLRGWLAEEPASVMLWEAPPLPETAARLAELGIEAIVFRPAGAPSEDGDFLSTMARNIEGLP